MQPLFTATKGLKPVPYLNSISENTGRRKPMALRKAVNELETAFLTEMLKSAGFGKSRESYGGGVGEDQFSSLLVRAQAEQMTLAGGIGLAESLFNALSEVGNGTAVRTRSD